MKKIATIRNNYTAKFGIPKQSGIIEELESRIVFEEEYRNKEALRGLDEYDYLWLIWLFSENKDQWHPTVRPPGLGGNRRMGVFATRSPFRPNQIGLSSVRLVRIDYDDPEAPVLIVKGADLMNGTPIIDIKPYLPYTDSHSDAKAGFSEKTSDKNMSVVFPPNWEETIDESSIRIVKQMLSKDPRPSYQNDGRIYGMAYGKYDIHFSIEGNQVIVIDIQKLKTSE